jgi:hypothetical protein
LEEVHISLQRTFLWLQKEPCLCYYTSSLSTTYCVNARGIRKKFNSISIFIVFRFIRSLLHTDNFLYSRQTFPSLF